MAVYTYDEEADALYVLLVSEPEAVVARTVELTDRLHIDVNAAGQPIGIEILYPSQGGIDLRLAKDRFGLEVRIPFHFAA